ncbi:substrate-binding domain-containing protein [Litoreibacter albidus]|uniref:substrate-binding domain-containing protein n=1 Tax=Litoreibacter albidus TaxID=670155 RepID=UPI003734CF2A
MTLIQNLRQMAANMPHGAKFPTVRQLVKELGATQYAIQSAIKALNDEGLLQSRVGDGTRVIGSDQSEQAAQGVLRVLLLHHVEPNARGEMITAQLHDDLTERGFRVVTIAYSNDDDISTLLGAGIFDICVLQPRFSVLTVRLLDVASRCSRHLIVEGKNMDGLGVDLVASDHIKSMRLALQHLIGLGHERVGLISEDRDGGEAPIDFEQLYEFWTHTTQQGFVRSFARRAAFSYDDAPVDQLVHCMADWKRMEAVDRPTALIVWGRFTAVQVHEATEANSISIPEDLSIVRVCSTSLEALHGGVFTTVGRSTQSISNAISQIVRWRADNPSAPRRTEHTSPEVLVRKSSASVPI